MKMQMKSRWRKWRKVLIVLLCLILAVQLYARFALGLGELPLFVENKYYEYEYAPSQDLYRFKNHFITNSLSMRSRELSKKDFIRILKFGDSVINGGAHIDHDRLSSTRLENDLTQKFQRQVRVLNISAQSWGPDNAFAYLEQHGNFNSKFFILVFSSHDLHDNMHFKKVVGVHSAWPEEQPWCALTDGISRYLMPKIKKLFGGKEEEYDYLIGFDDSKINPGWQRFIDYTQKNNIKLLVYVHATLKEIKDKSYDKYGLELIKMLENQKVSIIKGIDKLKDPECYRDAIHLNEKGHLQLTEILKPYLETYVQAYMNNN